MPLMWLANFVLQVDVDRVVSEAKDKKYERVVRSRWRHSCHCSAAGLSVFSDDPRGSTLRYDQRTQ